MEQKGSSRLLQMQARFQQRQLAEREMKIASLYEAQQTRALTRVRASPSHNSAPTPIPVRSTPNLAPGKVRQMFEERRTKAGIDKSYPLQPINNSVPEKRKPLPNGYTKISQKTSSTTSIHERKAVKTVLNGNGNVVNGLRKPKEAVLNKNTGGGDLNHNTDPDPTPIKAETKNGSVKTHPKHDANSNGFDEMDGYGGGGYSLEDETFPEALAPLPTPREQAKTPPPPPKDRRNFVKETKRSENPPTNPLNQKSPKKEPAKVKTEMVASSPSTDGRAAGRTRTFKPSYAINAVSTTTGNTAAPLKIQKQPASPSERKLGPTTTSTSLQGRSSLGSARSETAGSPEQEACTICGRRFNPDRIAKHESICRKTQVKKRKPFDILKHRLGGTEAEPFIRKLRKQTPSKNQVGKSEKPLNPNWRKQHEDFINAIRAAKEVKKHLAKGGKLSDLPPPPPSENPDYVACPHCGRRFNQAAAQRHIPKCQNYQHNKPKAQASRKR